MIILLLSNIVLGINIINIPLKQFNDTYYQTSDEILSWINYNIEKKHLVSNFNIDLSQTKNYFFEILENNNIISYNVEPLVSIDFNHNPASSIFDATQTQVVGDGFGRVLSWYDNEWGFSNRMIDVCNRLGSFL